MLDFLMLSNWESWFAIGFIVVSFVVLIFLKRKKISNFNLLIIASSIGLLGFAIFETFSTQFATTTLTANSWEVEVFQWLRLVPNIFILLTIIVIPLLMFVSFINYFINSKIDSRKRFVLINVLLMVLILIGIGIGMAFTPLLKEVDIVDVNTSMSATQDSLVGMITSWIPATLAIFASPIFIISVTILSILITVVMLRVKKVNEKTFEVVSSFFKHLNNVLLVYLMLVFAILPFVALTSISMLGVGNFFEIDVVGYIIFLAIVIAIALFIYFANVLMVYGLSRLKVNPDPNYKTLLFGSRFEFKNYLDDEVSMDQLRESRSFLNHDGQYNSFALWTKGASLMFNGGFLPTTIVIIAAQNSNISMDYVFYISITLAILFLSFTLRGVNSQEVTISIGAVQFSQVPLPSLYIFVFPLQLLLKPLNYFVNNTSSLSMIYFAEAFTQTSLYNRNVYEIQELPDFEEETGIDIVDDGSIVDEVDELLRSASSNDAEIKEHNTRVIEENTEDFPEDIGEKIEHQLNNSDEDKERNVW